MQEKVRKFNKKSKGEMEMSKYMYLNTKLPSYLPFPKFLLEQSLSNTAKILYSVLISRAQLSQKNGWVDELGRVYFIYPIHQMAVDLGKGDTTIKMALKELTEAKLLERVSEGRGKANRLYLLLFDEMVGQKSGGGNRIDGSPISDRNQGGNQSPSKYISNNRNSHLRDYDYEEEESFCLWIRINSILEKMVWSIARSVRNRWKRNFLSMCKRCLE